MSKKKFMTIIDGDDKMPEGLSPPPKAETKNELIEMADPFSVLQAQENETLQNANVLLNDAGNMKLKSDLDDSEISGLSRVAFMADIFELHSLKSWSLEFMMLRVSRKRKGRQEFLEAIKKPVDMMPKMGWFGGKQL